MAILVYDQPERYSLAYNDNPFVFRSTQYGQPGQRFKVSVADSSLNLISSERVYPRRGVTSNNVVSEDRTYFDPLRILQTQVDTPVAIPSANHGVISSASGLGFDYVVTILEEYKQNGVYIDGSVWISDLKTAWNGGVNKLDWLDFNYTDFDMVDGASSPRFLTNAPTTQYIDSDQSAFLYFLSSNNDVQQVSLVSYDSAGGVVQIGTINVTQSDNFSYVAVGTYDLENSDSSNWVVGSPATFLNGAAYYTVSLSTTTASEVFTFRINERCTKYDSIRLHWLNRLGGFDSHNFNYKSSEETDIDRRSYQQEEHVFSGTRWRYTKESRGMTDYYVGTQRKLKINTNYLSEAESTWIEDFATSPVIYQEVNNELIAVSGKVKNIGKQTSLNDKLMQYEFEIDYSLNDIRQRG